MPQTDRPSHESDPTGTLAEEMAKIATKKATEDTKHVCIQSSALRHINTELLEIKNSLREINERLAQGGTRMALLDERTGNLGRVIWGASAAIGLGLLACLGSAVVWVIAKAGGHP